MKINIYLAGLIGVLSPILIFGQSDKNYCLSSAVEEKLEITAYYPTTISYIGQFWDTSHNLFNFKTRQNVWIEPELESGFGFITAEFGYKKIPIYGVLQARFNSHTSIWVGVNTYLSDIKFFSNKVFYQLQIGAYRNLYKKEWIYSSYIQTKSFKRFFFEGIVNYSKVEQIRFEVEVGYKLTHSIALMGGFESLQNQNHFLTGIRVELYEHKR